MKKYSIIIFAIALISLAGCKKDLTIENPNQLTSGTYWSSADRAVRGVNAVYSTVHRGAISRWMLFYYIIRSDEGRSMSPATDIVNNMDQFVVTDYNYGNAYDVWRDLYVGIFRANQVIANVPPIDMDATLKQRIIGEASFLRAMFYFQLASLWGNVPLMLNPSTPADRPATSTREEVYAQIVTDLNVAIAGLPETYTESADIGRATKGAAYAMLAKTYLQQRKYSEALPALQWLVTGPGSTIYNLMPNYRDNFLISSENNMESVFEWQFQLNPADNHDDDTDPRADNLNYGSSLAQFFAPPGIGWSDGEAQRWPVYEFLKENTTGDERDPRLPATYIFDSTNIGGPDATIVYGQTFTQRYGADNKRIWFRKFLNDDWKNVEGYTSPNNWRYIRYADVLLMYAEAINATSGPADAYQYVDRVRTRAGLPTLTAAMPGLNQAAFLEQLKHERITELTGEGHRWNDLARWGDLTPALASRDAGFANFTVGKDELLPIPQAEIDFNPNLSQNPGWQ